MQILKFFLGEFCSLLYQKPLQSPNRPRLHPSLHLITLLFGESGLAAVRDINVCFEKSVVACYTNCCFPSSLLDISLLFFSKNLFTWDVRVTTL